jgi:hypothetical protein
MHNGLCLVAPHVGGYCSRATRLHGVNHHAALRRRQHDASNISEGQGVLLLAFYLPATIILQLYLIHVLQQDGPTIER